jgi:superfamily II DNA/RNA helicase
MPQVERILSQIEGDHQTLLFSATLDGAVDRLVKRYQHDPVFHEVELPDEESTAMKHRFIGVTDDERVAVSADIAAGPERALLFVRTQRGAKRLVQQLAREGVEATMLHGGMSQGQRERSLQGFKTKSNAVLVATNVAARGIHVDGVDIVIHHDPPEDAKTYLHRSGRTARAGAEGIVVTLVSPEQRREVDMLRRMAGIPEAVVAMRPGDERLTDLASWVPPTEAPRAANDGSRDQPRVGRQGSRWHTGDRRTDSPPTPRRQDGGRRGQYRGYQPAR